MDNGVRRVPPDARGRGAAMEHHGEAAASPRLGLTRLAVGLAQGLALYGLMRAEHQHVWPSTTPWLFSALGLTAAFIPLILLAGLGALRRATLIVWTAVATALVVGLAAHDVWRGFADPGHMPHSPMLAVFLAAALFIAHHLIEPADVARRPIAPYPAYFDTAWKHAVQLGLALAFVGAFWIVAHLGAALFKLIGIDFPERLLRRDWFHVVVSTVVFAGAVHLTDVKIGLIRGIRTVGLTLLAWLTPVMALIAVSFLAALPFTGLEPLWKTGRATALLLGSAGALVILLNAAYQDGATGTTTPTVLRWSGRLTAVLLTPLLAIAGYGLWLRVGQYGLTPDRIIASACLLVGVCYALGYAAAAAMPGPRGMRTFEATNVVTAVVMLAAILALFSPIADPARIAVADQVGRLERGEIAPEKFDYRFLRFDGVRYGREALQRLKAKKTGPGAAVIAAKAAEALALKHRWEEQETPPPAPADVAAHVAVHPKGRALPSALLNRRWTETETQELPCLRGASDCDAWFTDLDGDDIDEVLLAGPGGIWAYRLENKSWTALGRLDATGCGRPTAELLKKGFRPAKPQWRELEAGGRRLRVDPACELEPGKR
jgi:hypothetical protein